MHVDSPKQFLCANQNGYCLHAEQINFSLFTMRKEWMEKLNLNGIHQISSTEISCVLYSTLVAACAV